MQMKMFEESPEQIERISDLTQKYVDDRHSQSNYEREMAEGYVIEPEPEQYTILNGYSYGSTKSWLIYFGGKTAAAPTILESFPPGMTEMVSPFVGGGTVELLIASRGVRVYAYDKFELLTKLWNTMFEHAYEVSKKAIQMYPMDKEVLRQMFFDGYFYNCEDPIEQAAVCWVANKQDWNGRFLNASGFYEHKENLFTKRRAIVRRALNPEFWKTWSAPNLSVEHAIWEDSLSKHSELPVYADPPYVGNEKVYGKYRTKKSDPDYEEFNHEKFAHYMCNEHKAGWAISYHDDKDGLIRSLYKDYEIVQMRWHQGSVGSRQVDVEEHKRRTSSSTKEILIVKPPFVNPIEKVGSKL